MKIIFCGGHHNSALVVADELKKRNHEIFWFGHKYSMIGDANPSAEYLEVIQKGIPFYELKAGKWQVSSNFWRNFIRIPFGFFQSFVLLLKIRPDLIVSFGGYLALPVAVAGFLLGIPVVTHEQTVISGRANRIIAKIAKKVFVSYLSSVKYFSPKKVVYTGLPLRREILVKGKKIFENGKMTIYVTGGKQGSHLINQVIFSILPLLLEKYNVIHQCGSTSLFNDIKTANTMKIKLGGKAGNYLVKEYFSPEEIGRIFHSADLVVSRAGAHTVYELFALKKPAILIPITWSSQGEQKKNADLLVEIGLAMILTESKMKEGKLLETIINFGQNLDSYKIKKGIMPPPINAAEKIVSEISKIG